MTVSEILKALTKLNADELEQVGRAVTALKGMDGPVGASARAIKGKASALELILQVVRDVLEQRGSATLSTAVLTRGLKMQAAALASERLIKWAEKALPGNVNNQRALLGVGFGLLYDRLMHQGLWIDGERGVLITGRSLVQGMEQVPALVDLYFPGYVQNGLAIMVLRPEQKELRR